MAHRVPIAEAAYVSIPGPSEWMKPLLRPSRLQAALQGTIPVAADQRGWWVGSRSLQLGGRSINVAYRISSPQLKGDGLVRVTSDTQVFIVGALGDAMATDFGSIFVPGPPTMDSCAEGPSLLPELQGLMRTLIGGKGVQPVLLEDLTDGRSAPATLRAMACKFGVPMVEVTPRGLSGDTGLLEGAFFAACAHPRALWVLQDLDQLAGGVSAAELDFDDKLRLNLQLQRLLAHVPVKVLVVATCADASLLLPPTARLFEHRLALQRELPQLPASVRADPHPLDALFGAEEALRALEESILWPSRHADVFRALGAAGCVPPGLLLHGPSGCGKSALPRLFARRAGWELLLMRPFDVVKGEVGSSEKAVRDLFLRARRAAPCLLFIDELPAIFSASAPSLTTALLACMDDLREWNVRSGAPVAVLAAARELGAVPSACLQPHRFGRVVALGALSAEGRADFFRATWCSLLADMGLAETAPATPAPLELQELTQATLGCSGGELRQLLRRAERRFRRCFPSLPRGAEALLEAYLRCWRDELATSLVRATPFRFELMGPA